jgi:uncharacterized protein YbjT (DUF2867 family)
MRIVVIGGRGFIGSRLVNILRADGHEIVAASRANRVNALTGEGLQESLAGAQVLVDVANPPSFDECAALDFFTRSSRNLLAAGAAAGVRHHVTLSMIGADPSTESGYFRAKAAQEDLIRQSSLPYTIVRSAQSFEFMEAILEAGIATGLVIRLPTLLVQPIAADDLALALAAIAVAAPRSAVVEIAGPEPIALNELARLILSAHADPRKVIADAQARYFGRMLAPNSLMPGPDARIGSTSLRAWLRQFITAD